MSKTIFFINPEDSWAENKGDRPPLGISQLSSYLKQHKHKTKIIDMNHDTFNYSTVYLEPDFICVTISTPNYKKAINLAHDMKVRFPDCKLIAGGNHASSFFNEPKTLETFDYIVTGTDGEEALLRIVEGKATTQIVISKDIENLDSLPYPDYEGLDMKKYNMKIDGKKGMMLVGSRGCIYDCFFCGSAKIKKIRKHSPEYVVDHMKLLYDKYNIRGFYLGDDCFTYDKKWIEEWCMLVDIVFNSNKEDITIRITTRADLLTQNMCYELNKAGVNIICLGLESGSDKVLKAMNKGMTIEQQKQGIEYCYKAGIKTKGFFCFGLPKETWWDVMKTINFAKDLVKNGRLHYADSYILNPIPASPFWQNPEKFGIEIIKPKDNDWSKYYQTGTKVNIRHPYLSEEQLNKAVKLFREEVRLEGMTYE